MLCHVSCVMCPWMLDHCKDTDSCLGHMGIVCCKAAAVEHNHQQADYLALWGVLKPSGTAAINPHDQHPTCICIIDMLPVCVEFAGSNGSKSSSNSSCLLGNGEFLILQALLAYFRVLFVSSKSASQEDMQLMRMVSALPPRLSCSNLVNLESLQEERKQIIGCKFSTSGHPPRACCQPGTCCMQRAVPRRYPKRSWGLVYAPSSNKRAFL